MSFWRSTIVVELWQPEVTSCQFFSLKMLRFLDKKIFEILFQKNSPSHQPMCCVQISLNLVNGNRRNRVLLTWPKKKQNFAWLSRCRYCVDRTQNLPGPALGNVLKVFQISSKWFNFGRVIAKCVNTVKMRLKVNPIFGWSLASSQIIKPEITCSHLKLGFYIFT